MMLKNVAAPEAGNGAVGYHGAYGAGCLLRARHRRGDGDSRHDPRISSPTTEQLSQLDAAMNTAATGYLGRASRGGFTACGPCPPKRIDAAR